MEICRDETLVAGLHVLTDLRAPFHHAKADHARLMQIVWNLIRNAAKFTPPNGRLTIRTTNPSAVDGQSPRLVIEFEDTGIGIDPEVLPRMFAPFEKGHDDFGGRAGGLGLGLAISRALAEALGGRLTASSPGRGRGSTFRLELAAAPATASKPAPGPTANPAAGPIGSPPLRILLVEDNKDTLRYLAAVLRRRGHDVVTADSLAAARAAVSETEVPFELLLSDISELARRQWSATDARDQGGLSTARDRL